MASIIKIDCLFTYPGALTMLTQGNRVDIFLSIPADLALEQGHSLYV